MNITCSNCQTIRNDAIMQCIAILKRWSRDSYANPGDALILASCELDDLLTNPNNT